MLTPEERARAVVTNFQGDHYWIFTEPAIVEVAEAIQVAVTEATTDLLAACEAAEACFKHWELSPAEQRAVNLLRAAIAKVRGA